MDGFTGKITRSQPYTFRRLRVGRTSGSRQASPPYLWYLTIAGVPAPRRKPAPGCVIHKTRPTGPDTGQHGGLPGGNLQPKGLSQGEQWRRRPNTSVRASLCLQSLMEGSVNYRAANCQGILGKPGRWDDDDGNFGLRPIQPSTETQRLWSRSFRQGRKLHAIRSKAANCRQALKCTIQQAQEVDRAGAFHYNS